MHFFTRLNVTEITFRSLLRRQLWLSLCCAVLTLSLAVTARAQDDTAGAAVYQETVRLIANGQQMEASDALRRIVRDYPEHAGAWLDLAILRCKMGYAEEAERLFAELAVRFELPPAIQEVIARQHVQGCSAPPPPAGRLSMTLGRGYDSNVNLGAITPFLTIGSGSSLIELQLLPEYLPKRDNFTVFSADYARDLNADGTTGVAQLQVRKNDVQSQYDAALVAVGVEQRWHAGDWRLRGAANLAVLSLGGALYQQLGHLNLLVSPPLHLPEGMRLDLSGGVTRIAYPTQPDYDATVREMRGLLNYKTEQVQVQMTAAYYFDRALSVRPGGDRHGWSTGIQGNSRVVGDVFGELGWNRLTWRSESAYSPGLIDQARYQITDVFRAALIIPVAAHQAVSIELRQVRDRENISIFQYDDRQVLVNWLWRDF